MTQSPLPNDPQDRSHDRELLKHHLALALIPGLGPRLTSRILSHFGSPAAARHATEKDLSQIEQMGPKLARSVVSAFAKVDPEVELARMEQYQARALYVGHPEYPAWLATIPDAPPLFYLRGSLLPVDQNAIALVGSRQCTPYGIRMAERIAAGLARAGWTVVSGLARGIDGAAHRAAVDAGGRTLAVLANGLASVYPPEHADLAEQVAGQGALITEANMTAAPQAGMFPARNRIISGLSQAVVVVEANVRSGALITVEHAAEQGRPVFAVPGSVESPASAGCLELIRTGATLVRDADDILAEIRGLRPDSPRQTPASTAKPKATPAGPSLFDPPREAPPAVPPPQMEESHRRIWDRLDEPRHADELARDLEISIGDLTRILMILEMKKLIRRLPGNRYERRT